MRLDVVVSAAAAGALRADAEGGAERSSEQDDIDDRLSATHMRGDFLCLAGVQRFS